MPSLECIRVLRMGVSGVKKDLSYLNAFNPKILREARRIINHGITVEDIDEFLKQPFEPKKIYNPQPRPNLSMLRRPCCDDKEENEFFRLRTILRFNRNEYGPSFEEAGIELFI
ncbi:unnamed protein product [marine sediment metagenome]|uniref:Uncharacterized protein n=1 Tax=marine sediment metagenome TaxID=412755 RepID=X1VYP1_9ZZZZ